MDKDKESRGRDLKKNGVRLFSSSSSSPSPSGSNINCNGRDVYVMETSSRKERAKGLKGSCSDNKEDRKMDGKRNGGGSEGEEGNIFCPPLNTNGSSSRKRIKLQVKVSDCRGSERPVGPPLVVPKAAKRLRSAINKHTSQSASPPLSDSKRGREHAHDETQLLNISNGEKFQQQMLEEPTKDEEEVAATLISIASLITISKPLITISKPLEKKEDGKVLQENSETKATLASLLEAPKEEHSKFLVPCNGTTVSNSVPYADDISRLGQTTGASVGQRLDAEGHEPRAALSSNVEPVDGVTDLTDPRKFSGPLGTSLQYFPQNGMLQPKLLAAHLQRKQEVKPSPVMLQLGATFMDRDVHSFNRKPETVASDVGLKDPFSATASSLQPGLLCRGHEQLTMPPSNEAVAYPNSIVISQRPGGANGLDIEKLFLSPADKEQQWNRCRTHVRICHLIKNHEKAEELQLSVSKENLLKARGTHQSVPASSEVNGSNNTLEARNHLLQNARHLQAQQAAMLSGVYALQKQVLGDAKTSGSEKKSGQFPAPYPPNQVYMPFSFSQGSYSQFQERLAAGPSQQVQLQLPPHYLATGQLYGPHMGRATAAMTATSTTTKQQQLMWQAHLAHYRPPMGFPPNWQQGNGPHDSSSSPSSLVNQPSSIFPLPADFNPQNLHQAFIFPSPLSSLPMRSNQNPQGSARLQMISNAESFR